MDLKKKIKYAKTRDSHLDIHTLDCFITCRDAIMHYLIIY